MAGAMTHKNKNRKGKIKNELLARLFQEVRRVSLVTMLTDRIRRVFD